MFINMDALVRIFKKLLDETDTTFSRYLYYDIDWSDRIIGIKGPRGVGKTTMMLQYIKEHLDFDEVLYVNADDIYFGDHRLIDLAEKLVQRGVRYFFIDEIHKYRDWSKELKLIYDYYRELKVVFSGSSVLDLDKGSADLSRRAVMYHLYGLSFREYLSIFKNVGVPVFTLDDILSGMPEKISLKTPLLHFEEYLKRGYYPFSGDGSFYGKLRQIVSQTLENDITVFADMPSAMGRKFKKLLAVIARSVPFKPNMSKLAEIIGAGRNQMPSLLFVLAESEVNVGNLRETFFLSQMRVRNAVVSSSISDFMIGERTFEIGGRSKGLKQIEKAKEGYVVKDDIEYSSGNILPLWWFGLNY